MKSLTDYDFSAEPNDGGPEWTLTHGFLTTMGGFMLWKDSQPFRPLTHSELYYLIDNRVINLPSIPTKEIMDKSKGDSLSKFLVVLQLGWFVLQCLARAVQHLVITELELVTIAFSILSMVTYVLWWDKPLLVQCSIPIPVPHDYEEPKKREKDDDVWGFRRAFAFLLKVQTPIESAILRAAQRRNPPPNHDGVWGKFKYWTLGTVKSALLPIGWLVFNCFSMGWSERGAAASQKYLRVSTFYAGRMEYLDGPLSGVATTIIAMIFGAIHCMAWSFAFVTPAERILWRTSSIIIMVIPVLYLAVFGILSLCFCSDLPALRPWLKDLLEKVFCFYLFSNAFLYGAARISLLLQPFLSLRSLPPGAYQVVQWTDFIPHI